jgi:toxin ParE1/3/4
MMPIIIRPAAETDIREASEWYEERELGLGGRFLDELRGTFTRIARMPLQFPSIGKGLRRALLKRFPYAIYFVPRDDSTCAVLAVLHQRRNPNIWKKRLQTEGKLPP